MDSHLPSTTPSTTPSGATASARSVFIDFDGTFADHGRVPAAHLDAVQSARAAGHRVFLCTGRPRVFVAPRLRSGVFDGLVCAAGGYAEIDGQVLADRRFPAELGAEVASTLTAADATFFLEAPDRVLTSPASARRLEGFLGHVLGPGEPEPTLEVHQDLTGCSFSKVSVQDGPMPVDQLAEELGPQVGALPNSITGRAGSSGELYLAGVDKSVGIAVVEKHLGLRRADIIAIGDGRNDLEMIGYAGTGVAVEGAPQRVLDAAQLVIPGPASEGIARCFQQLGLIPSS